MLYRADELAKLLQEQEHKRTKAIVDQRKLREIETQDARLAEIIQEQEKIKARRTRGRREKAASADVHPGRECQMSGDRVRPRSMAETQTRQSSPSSDTGPPLPNRPPQHGSATTPHNHSHLVTHTSSSWTRDEENHSTPSPQLRDRGQGPVSPGHSRDQKRHSVPSARSRAREPHSDSSSHSRGHDRHSVPSGPPTDHESHLVSPGHSIDQESSSAHCDQYTDKETSSIPSNFPNDHEQISGPSVDQEPPSVPYSHSNSNDLEESPAASPVRSRDHRIHPLSFGHSRDQEPPHPPSPDHYRNENPHFVLTGHLLNEETHSGSRQPRDQEIHFISAGQLRDQEQHSLSSGQLMDQESPIPSGQSREQEPPSDYWAIDQEGPLVRIGHSRDQESHSRSSSRSRDQHSLSSGQSREQEQVADCWSRDQEGHIGQSRDQESQVRIGHYRDQESHSRSSSRSRDQQGHSVHIGQSREQESQVRMGHSRDQESHSRSSSRSRDLEGHLVNVGHQEQPSDCWSGDQGHSVHVGQSREQEQVSDCWSWDEEGHAVRISQPRDQESHSRSSSRSRDQEGHSVHIGLTRDHESQVRVGHSQDQESHYLSAGKSRDPEQPSFSSGQSREQEQVPDCWSRDQESQVRIGHSRDQVSHSRSSGRLSSGQSREQEQVSDCWSWDQEGHAVRIGPSKDQESQVRVGLTRDQESQVRVGHSRDQKSHSRSSGRSRHQKAHLASSGQSRDQEQVPDGWSRDQEGHPVRVGHSREQEAQVRIGNSREQESQVRVGLTRDHESHSLSSGRSRDQEQHSVSSVQTREPDPHSVSVGRSREQEHHIVRSGPPMHRDTRSHCNIHSNTTGHQRNVESNSSIPPSGRKKNDNPIGTPNRWSHQDQVSAPSGRRRDQVSNSVPSSRQKDQQYQSHSISHWRDHQTKPNPTIDFEPYFIKPPMTLSKDPELHLINSIPEQKRDDSDLHSVPINSALPRDSETHHAPPHHRKSSLPGPAKPVRTSGPHFATQVKTLNSPHTPHPHVTRVTDNNSPGPGRQSNNANSGGNHPHASQTRDNLEETDAEEVSRWLTECPMESSPQSGRSRTSQLPEWDTDILGQELNSSDRSSRVSGDLRLPSPSPPGSYHSDDDEPSSLSSGTPDFTPSKRQISNPISCTYNIATAIDPTYKRRQHEIEAVDESEPKIPLMLSRSLPVHADTEIEWDPGLRGSLRRPKVVHWKHMATLRGGTLEEGSLDEEDDGLVTIQGQQFQPVQGQRRTTTIDRSKKLKKPGPKGNTCKQQ